MDGCIAERKSQSVSLPVRGAWVEIRLNRKYDRKRERRSPCGERGLKS